jgi:hypothetical protein
VIFFSKVEDTFEIAGRGLVIVPAVPRPDLDFQLRTKDSIQLLTPGGQIVDTYIASVEMICGPKVEGRMAFLLPRTIAKCDVPKETEIWLMQKP